MVMKTSDLTSSEVETQRIEDGVLTPPVSPGKSGAVDNRSYTNDNDDEAAARTSPLPYPDEQSTTENSSSANGGRKNYIASLDVGTTIVRCLIFDKNAKIKTQAEEKVL